VTRTPADERPLALYFKDLVPIRVMDAEQELALSREIEAAELALWRQLLALPSVVERLLAAARGAASSDAAVPGASELSDRAAALADDAAGTDSVYREQQCRAAVGLREADVDRTMLSAALAEVERLTTRETSPATRRYAAAVGRRATAAAHARNAFVAANLRLVIRTARAFNSGILPLDDLIQEGNMGLIKAVERFDYKLGYRFSTYATWWIRHAITRALADKGRLVRIPVHMQEAYRKTNKVRRALSQEAGQAVTLEEVAEEAGLDVEQLRTMELDFSTQSVPFDDPGGKGRARLADQLTDPEDRPPLERMVEAQSAELAVSLLSRLEPMEADILRRRFGLQGAPRQTLREIGRIYQRSRERIRQLERQALEKLGRLMAREEASASSLTAAA
jgi:RNA polymerase primary sigma factor